MGGQSKIPDRIQLVQWMQAGHTNKEIQDMYRASGLRDFPSTNALSNFRSRNGLPVKAQAKDLIPWVLAPQHRGSWAAKMLRLEARCRRGETLREPLMHQLDAWKAAMDEGGERAGAVVHYDRDTERGFHYVPRREGIDTDLIRDPSKDDKGEQVSG